MIASGEPTLRQFLTLEQFKLPAIRVKVKAAEVSGAFCLSWRPLSVAG
jgi:hypothetical protein